MRSTYSTSYKTWAIAITLDAVFGALFFAGAFQGTPYAKEIAVFFLWVITLLAIFVRLVMAAASIVGDLMVRSAESSLSGMPNVEEQGKKMKDGIWTKDYIDRMAYSQTFLVYHWLSEIAFLCLFIAAGHTWLAIFSTYSFLWGCIHIGEARKRFKNLSTT